MQFEYLLPWQLRERVASRPVAYIPLGTYEWHGEHLPVGLDSLTSHGLCLRAAMVDGGIAFPPHYYGTGGGHGAYPWTIIKDNPDEIESQLHFTLQRMETFGFKLAVLFSGHFADTQLDMIDRVASRWNSKDGALKVFATAVNRIEGLAIGPDHAALFETTLLVAMHPELVHLENLADTPLPVDENPFGTQRHDTAHPLYGIFGPDPRKFNPAQAKPLLDASVAWLVSQVRKHIPTKDQNT
ncbi:creatininase family protein [Aestuariivirga litoralis]|nr:creatininase family protein [Aestuariivirga litoralis]